MSWSLSYQAIMNYFKTLYKHSHKSSFSFQIQSRKPSMDSKISWPAMEIDCLAEIFMRLDLDDITLIVPFVGRSWLAAGLRPLCWKRLDFQRVNVLPWSNFSKTFTFIYSLPYFSFTYFLKQAVKSRWSSGIELRLPPKFASSQDLEFISNEGNKSRDVMTIISYVPQIMKLDLSGSYLPKKDLLNIVKGYKHLYELKQLPGSLSSAWERLLPQKKKMTRKRPIQAIVRVVGLNAFVELQKSENELGISNIQLGLPTLEEFFLNIAKQAELESAAVEFTIWTFSTDSLLLNNLLAPYCNHV